MHALFRAGWHPHTRGFEEGCFVRAVQFHTYGEPDVLRVDDVPEPHAGPGEVRIRVAAASVNAMDWKLRAGYLSGGKPLSQPQRLGFDGSGVVDEVGEGVNGVAVGDDVFGLGSGTQAEFAVLRSFVRKPASVDWAVAGAAGIAVETAARAFGLLGVGAGSTVLVDGGAGGVGAVAVQVARARGARVIATASEANQDYLREIGAIPVLYGAGMPERVRQLGEHVDAVLDVAGKTALEALTALVAEPSQVVSIANFAIEGTGARVTSGGEGDPQAALAEGAHLLEQSQLVIKVQTFPLDRVAEAHEISQAGHVRGKLVLLP
jgi:NADPH:quinone reductase-like Zn-dependent oxidoreductase